MQLPTVGFEPWSSSSTGGAENDGENAGHEIDGPICMAFAGHEIAGREIAACEHARHETSSEAANV